MKIRFRNLFYGAEHEDSIQRIYRMLCIWGWRGNSRVCRFVANMMSRKWIIKEWKTIWDDAIIDF